MLHETWTLNIEHLTFYFGNGSAYYAPWTINCILDSFILIVLRIFFAMKIGRRNNHFHFDIGQSSWVSDPVEQTKTDEICDRKTFCMNIAIKSVCQTWLLQTTLTTNVKLFWFQVHAKQNSDITTATPTHRQTNKQNKNRRRSRKRHLRLSQRIEKIQCVEWNTKKWLHYAKLLRCHWHCARWLLFSIQSANWWPFYRCHRKSESNSCGCWTCWTIGVDWKRRCCRSPSIRRWSSCSFYSTVSCARKLWKLYGENSG